jgi:RimJ/RimL family protein N-acetyltransferase
MSEAVVSIEPWGHGDRALLGRILGDPQMTEHVGGPESEEKLDSRHARYAKPGSRQYKVLCDGEPCGYVGYWERPRPDLPTIWETGWFIVPEFQGRGIASQGMLLLLDVIRGENSWSELHAWPAVDNAASNALCRRLGFELVGSFDYDFRGAHLRCNDWRMEVGGGGDREAPA